MSFYANGIVAPNAGNVGSIYSAPNTYGANGALSAYGASNAYGANGALSAYGASNAYGANGALSAYGASNAYGANGASNAYGANGASNAYGASNTYGVTAYGQVSATAYGQVSATVPQNSFYSNIASSTRKSKTDSCGAPIPYSKRSQRPPVATPYGQNGMMGNVPVQQRVQNAIGQNQTQGAGCGCNRLF